MPMSFDEFKFTYPDRVDGELFDPVHGLRISDTAVFEAARSIGFVARVGKVSHVGSGVMLENGVYVGDSVRILDGTALAENVRITDDFEIGHGVFMGAGSSVSPLTREASKNFYKRHIHSDSIIGKSVILPSEVQIGPWAIIPTSDAIAQIGPFGTSSRMVTVHGSDDGPVYNVGCQKGIDARTFKKRVAGFAETSKESAADYRNNMDRIIEKAEKTQEAYEEKTHLIAELKEEAIVFLHT